MPSINLIWDQRRLRERNQRTAVALLVVIGLSGLWVGNEMVQTTITRRRCQGQIADSEAKIKQKAPRALKNQRLQAEVGAFQPTLFLLQEAQKMTLRWVFLLQEFDKSVPDPSKFSFTSMNFAASTAVAAAAPAAPAAPPPPPPGGAAPPPPAGGAAPPAAAAAAAAAGPMEVGTLTVAGSAQSYALVSQVMRNLQEQPHVEQVKLTQASAQGKEGSVRFQLEAKFQAPAEEAEMMNPTPAPAAAGQDLPGKLQTMAQGTALNRVPDLKPAP